MRWHRLLTSLQLLPDKTTPITCTNRELDNKMKYRHRMIEPATLFNRMEKRRKRDVLTPLQLEQTSTSYIVDEAYENLLQMQWYAFWQVSAHLFSTSLNPAGSEAPFYTMKTPSGQ